LSSNVVLLQKNILTTFCSSDELVVVTTSCIVSEFLQQNRIESPSLSFVSENSQRAD
jgi:hypothetical protein